MDTFITIALFIILCGLGATAGYLIANLRQRTSLPSGNMNQLSSKETSEIVRIWRTTDNQLKLEMNGQPLAEAKAISPEQRRQLVKIVVDLRPWLEASSGIQSSPSSGEGISSETVINRPSNPADAPGASSSKPLPGEGAAAAYSSKSIVDQIDDFLQVLLANSGLKNRDIHLTEGAGGGVFVRVGLTQYEGIDSVPEPEIKNMVRRAIAEWEKSSN